MSNPHDPFGLRPKSVRWEPDFKPGEDKPQHAVLYEIHVELLDDPDAGRGYGPYASQAEADAVKDVLDDVLRHPIRRGAYRVMDDASSVFGCFEVTIHERRWEHDD